VEMRDWGLVAEGLLTVQEAEGRASRPGGRPGAT
jgi:hypothetical protein